MALKELEALAHQWRTGLARTSGVRVVAFGSSNTQLSYTLAGRFNWPEWLHAGIKQHVDSHALVINAGIGGETTDDLLRRFDRDVAQFTPAAVIVTIGGNDVRRLSLETYGANLRELVARIKVLGAQPVLQTYYAVLDTIEPPPRALFPRFMEECRITAREQAVPLIDIYACMDPWYRAEPEAYGLLMRDAWHLNGLGCGVMGTLHTRAWGFPDPHMDTSDRAEVDRCLTAMSRYADLPPKIG